MFWRFLQHANIKTIRVSVQKKSSGQYFKQHMPLPKVTTADPKGIDQGTSFI
jgi:hypothetical protein